MTKRSMQLVATSVVVAIVLLIFATYVVSTVNAEVRLRNTIEAKQRDNQSEYDSLWKKISQAVEVTEGQKEALIEIFQAHAEARGGTSDGALLSWLHESVPDVDTGTFQNLQNIIAASRDRFAMRQKELLALKSDHDTAIESFPSGTILSLLGREPVDVTIITSTKAREIFELGEDDDVDLGMVNRD